MVKAGETWQVPFIAAQSTRLLRTLQADTTAITVTLTKSMLAYISGELSASSVSLVPTDQPPTTYD